MTRRLSLAAASTLIVSAVLAPTTLAAAKPFVAKGGTVSIDFDPAFVTAMGAAGVEYTTGRTSPVPAMASFPKLTIAAAADQPSRAPRTPLNTAKPAGYVYIGEPEIAFYSGKGEAVAEFPVIKLGAHPAVDGQLEDNAMFKGDGRLHPLFTLATRGAKPSMRGSTLTLRSIPMSLSSEGAALLQVLGTGLKAGDPVGKLTIKAHR